MDCVYHDLLYFLGVYSGSGLKFVNDPFLTIHLKCKSPIDDRAVVGVKYSVSHTKEKWCVLSYTISPHDLMFQELIVVAMLAPESYSKPNQKQTKALPCKTECSLDIQLWKSWNVLTVVVMGYGSLCLRISST